MIKIANHDLPARIESDMLAEDPDLRDVVEEFVHSLPDRAQQFRQALGVGDLERIRTLGHQLKGAGGSYGYPALSLVGATLESASRTGAADELTAAMVRFEKLITAIQAGLC
jgi:HPt (histidine-containing phosphotransfer) domain-containing protein